MAMYTHHTTTRPRFPPGSIQLGTYTLSQYLPQEDAAVRVRMGVVGKYLPVPQRTCRCSSQAEKLPANTDPILVNSAGLKACPVTTACLSTHSSKPHLALQELHLVVEKVQPLLPALLPALEAYHLHSADGWITTAG